MIQTETMLDVADNSGAHAYNVLKYLVVHIVVMLLLATLLKLL